ncbi:MAG: hypothetical protein ABEK29_00680, partial [Bradymonadaceae bacterium]
MRNRNIIGLVIACALLVGCGGTTDKNTPSDNDGGPISVPSFSGKADNYVSSNAREFELTGTIRANLPDNFSELEGQEREEPGCKREDGVQ